MTDTERVAIMKEHGIERPSVVLEEARAADLGLALACAVLDQESGGGANVFGHDRDEHGVPIWHGRSDRVEVTEERYRAYKVFRDIGPARRMQGVGPLQLTWYSLQDAADIAGGCWKPRFNMRIGFLRLAALVAAKGLREGVRSYNGFGSAAETYADEVLDLRRRWRQRLEPA